MLAQLIYSPSHRAQKVLAFINWVGKALAREVYQYARELTAQTSAMPAIEWVDEPVPCKSKITGPDPMR